MTEKDKERVVNLGFPGWLLAGLLIGSLWGIDSSLRKIAYQLTLANCLTQAADGVVCTAAKTSK